MDFHVTRVSTRQFLYHLLAEKRKQEISVMNHGRYAGVGKERLLRQLANGTL